MSDRICDVCNELVVSGQPDPCLGFIEGISAACCGHGNNDNAYVSFYLSNGGFVAWDGGFTHMTKQQLEEAEEQST